MPRFDRKGVQTALGADGAPCNNNLDAMTEMRLAALIHKPTHGPDAMPAKRIVRLATIDGARALGLDDHIGSLEPGKAADLCLLDLDHSPSTTPGGDIFSQIVYSASASHVTDVFVAGDPIVRDGELLDVDMPRLLDDARTTARDIAAEVF
jgi:cytosine/adenosine deaminase-related metal-dependent hydrolase